MGSPRRGFNAPAGKVFPQVSGGPGHRPRCRRSHRRLADIVELLLQGKVGAAVDRQVDENADAVRQVAIGLGKGIAALGLGRSEEHTSELQSLMRISYAVFFFKNKKM